MASDAQIRANRENAKKAGRKKGIATIQAEKLKAYIAERVAENGEAIVAVLLAKALDGDIPATKELFDRGFGKASQQTDVDITSKGEKLTINDDQLNQLIRARTARTDNS